MPRIWLPVTVLIALGVAFVLFLTPPSAEKESSATPTTANEEAQSSANPLSTESTPGVIKREDSVQPSFAESAMKEFGLVEVLVVDDLGQPLQGEFRVELQILHPPDPEGGRHKTNYWSVHYQKVRNGRCLFERTGFERKLKVLVSNYDRNLDRKLETVSPTRDQGRATIRIEFYQGRCLLTGKLVSKDGKALANQTLSCTLNYSPIPRGGFSSPALQTDSSGNFVLALDPGFDAGESVLLKIRKRPTRSQPPGSFQTKLIPFFGKPRKDLGTITLEDEAVAVSGMVIDENRVPIANADVFLMPIFEQADDLDQFIENNHYEMLSTTTDAQGEFQFYGDASLLKYHSVTAEQTGFLFLNEEESSPGYHVLQMRRWIKVRGRLLLDPDIDRESLEIVLRRPDGEESIGSREPLETDGSIFRFPRQMPGDQIDFIVRSKFLKEELYREHNLVLSLDEKHLDLGTIDLRGVLNSISISVKGTQGRLLPSPWAWTESMEEKAYFEQPLKLIRGEEFIQLVIGVDDRPYRVVGDPRSNLDLTLPRGIPVEIVVSPMPDFGENWYFYGGLHDIHETENLWLPFLSDDPPIYRLEVPAPGTYQVEFQISHWSEGNGWSEAFSILPREGMPMIEIQKGNLTQSFALSWNPAEAELLQQHMLELEANQ